jgi:integrase
VLSDTQIKRAKPRQTAYKLADEKGLYLLVTPTGARSWRFKYRIHGREGLLTLGLYPDVSLAIARDKRDEARKQLAAGTDPAKAKRAAREAQAETFEAVAREWLKQREGSVIASTLARDLSQLERLVFPYIGSDPIAKIEAADLRAVLRRVEALGINDTAYRVEWELRCVFALAVATGRAQDNPATDTNLRATLKPRAKKTYGTNQERAPVGELLRAIDGYQGQPATYAALRLAPLLFVRPGELRAAEWSEFEKLHGAEPLWRIPAAKMKMRDAHIVPLAPQAVAIIRGLEAITGGGKYLFPALTTPTRPMSENTLNGALKRLGYSSEEQTPHGFRSIASTLLNELGHAPDLIELQLAHKERNQSRAAYNKAQRLPERRRMMVAWADYIDGLKAEGEKVVAIKRGRES